MYATSPEENSLPSAFHFKGKTVKVRSRAWLSKLKVKVVLRANDLFVSLLRKVTYSSWAFPEGGFHVRETM